MLLSPLLFLASFFPRQYQLLLPGVFTRLGGVLGVLMALNLWLGLYRAPYEWPWEYFFLIMPQNYPRGLARRQKPRLSAPSWPVVDKPSRIQKVRRHVFWPTSRNLSRCQAYRLGVGHHRRGVDGDRCESG